MANTDFEDRERTLRWPPQQLRMQQQERMQHTLCPYWVAGNCLQGRKCRMVHRHEPSPDEQSEPVDEQLYEAVSWLEAMV